MSKKADKRYQNAEEMALDIKRYLTRKRRENERRPKADHAEQPANAPTFQQSRLFWPVCGAIIAVLIAAYSFWDR